MDDERDPMDPAHWYDEPSVCGSCIAWRAETPQAGEEVAAGICRLRPELRRVPATMAQCDIYKPRGRFTYDPGRAASPKRRKNKVLSVVRVSADGTEDRTSPAAPRPRPPIPAGNTAARPTFDPLPTSPRPRPPGRDVPQEVDLGGNESVPVLRQTLIDLVRQEHGRTSREIHSKFRGGRVEARGEGVTVSHDAERLFSMLDRLQSALRALESAAARRADRLGPDVVQEVRETIGRIEGSLTTFNVLYQHREDWFSSK